MGKRALLPSVVFPCVFHFLSCYIVNGKQGVIIEIVIVIAMLIQ